MNSFPVWGWLIPPLFGVVVVFLNRASESPLGILLLVGYMVFVLPLLIFGLLAIETGWQILYIYPVWLAAFAFVCFLNAPLKGWLRTFQRVLATAWLVVRRVLSFTLAAICLVVGVLLLVFALSAAGSWHGFLGGSLFLLLAMCLAWVGVFGQGRNRYELRDDIDQHSRNRKRFGWRW